MVKKNVFYEKMIADRVALGPFAKGRIYPEDFLKFMFTERELIEALEDLKYWN